MASPPNDGDSRSPDCGAVTGLGRYGASGVRSPGRLALLARSAVLRYLVSVGPWWKYGHTLQAFRTYVSPACGCLQVPEHRSAHDTRIAVRAFLVLWELVSGLLEQVEGKVRLWQNRG